MELLQTLVARVQDRDPMTPALCASVSSPGSKDCAGMYLLVLL